MCTRVLCKCSRADECVDAQAALWNQKAREGVVVWDYHVILVLRPRLLRKLASAHGEMAEADAWIYDFDTRCPLPCRWLGEIETIHVSLLPLLTGLLSDDVLAPHHQIRSH